MFVKIKKEVRVNQEKEKIIDTWIARLSLIPMIFATPKLANKNGQAIFLGSKGITCLISYVLSSFSRKLAHPVTGSLASAKT